MGKKIRFSTISLGSEPDNPDIPALLSFIRRHRGKEVDLISALIENSLLSQKRAELDHISAGGRYLNPRFSGSLERDKTGLQGDMTELISDASLIVKTAGTARSALPVPSEWPEIPDMDEDEQEENCRLFSRLLRKMRDQGVRGHILHTSLPSPLELEILASPKNLFFLSGDTQKAQEEILEVQSTLILPEERRDSLPDLLDRYTVRRVVVLEPSSGTLQELLEVLDPENILVGGYAIGDEEKYWNEINKKAVISI